MIERRAMIVEDFLKVMDANKAIYPAYDALADEHKRFIAKVNMLMGTAYSYFKDGEFWGVGGIRYIGVGEAWLIGSPETRKQLTMPEFAFIKERFEQERDEKNLWRVFAESSISDVFLRRLGFVKQDGFHVWTRQ